MLKLSDASKQLVFAEDLAMIGSDEIREFTKKVLDTFPWYFWVQPASTTGKYHPKCTLGRGGLLVHTKRVIFFGKKLIRAHGWNIPSDKADRIISAMILHDGQKGGRGYGPYEDYENHPLLVQERSDPKIQVPVGLYDTVQEIFAMIKYHMGPWTPEAAYKPLDKYTEEELIVYHADYLAAQKDLKTPVDGSIAAMNLVYEEEETPDGPIKPCSRKRRLFGNDIRLRGS